VTDFGIDHWFGRDFRTGEANCVHWNHKYNVKFVDCRLFKPVVTFSCEATRQTLTVDGVCEFCVDLVP